MAPFGKKKGSKNEVVFQVHIHSIEPWPAAAADKPLTVAWERGTGHKGSLDAVQPSRRAAGTVFEFEETIVVPCTLAKVHSREMLRMRWLPALMVFCIYKHC